MDVIGVRRLLDAGKPDAVAAMKQVHHAVATAKIHYSRNTEICVWNDSVLIHSIVSESDNSYVEAMRPLAILKATVDTIRPSFAICVKGQSLRSPNIPVTKSRRSFRFIYLSASSLALTNCFEVEKALKHHRKDWYIDARIMRRIKSSLSRDGDATEKVSLYPRDTCRTFHMFKNSFIREKE